jgi:hypothetical protein
MDIKFDVSSEIIVVGSNPEMADVTNPYGHIHDIAYFVIGTYPSGKRIRHCRNFRGIVKASRFCDRVKEANSINIRYWTDHRPVYGSVDYEQNVQEEIALEKKEEETC